MLPREIRIINTPWHLGHQWELTKLPNTKWYHIINSVRKWTKNPYRPMPDNVYQVPHYEKGKYDLAVLHIDQQCVDPKLGKSKLFKQLDEAITDIPKIVINHGTPYWPEVFTDDEIRLKMKMLLFNKHAVFNSDEAQRMWGNPGLTNTTIIHGMDPAEWYDNPNKEPIIFTSLSEAGLDMYYNRQLLISVKDKCRQRGLKHIWVQKDLIPADFEEYRQFISRGLIYFNPTLQSPMPRSRTEAMLSGAMCVTLGNHGAEKFIESGKNGIIVPNNPNVIVDLFDRLINGGQYQACKLIGQNGKKTAMELFSKERYQADWEALIRKVLSL